MHQLTNVPTAASGLEIKGVVDGETIRIVCAKRHVDRSDPFAELRMTDLFVGDHMLSKPSDLREMFASNLATMCRMARDAGYAQAKAEIRHVLGVKAE